MEITRKGKAKSKLTPEMVEEMKRHDVPDWYIDSCFKIKYMFPKAHAVAYDMSALRLGWFKVHMPQVFYAAFLSVAPGGFDADIVTKGKENIKAVLREIEAKGKDASQKETDMIATLQLCNEACARGFVFLRPDIKKSHSFHFLPEGEKGIRCRFPPWADSEKPPPKAYTTPCRVLKFCRSRICAHARRSPKPSSKFCAKTAFWTN